MVFVVLIHLNTAAGWESGFVEILADCINACRTCLGREEVNEKQDFYEKFK